MAYFNHAFQKSFLMDSFTEKAKGQLGTTGNQLAKGELALVNAKTWNILDTTYATANPGCCNIVIANGSLYQNDKIGPFAGGYLESNKSKEINPKYVSRLYTVQANLPQAMVVNVGSTPYTVAEDSPSCCKEFLCGETYYLRLDVKGSPAMRFLDHNAYLTVDAYTGCCAPDAISPTPVDSTEVMIKWADQIVNSPLISPFILPVVVAEDLSLWYAPGTNTIGYVAPVGYTIGGTWDEYVSPGHEDGACAGLVLNGAYVDTKFGDCSFQISDFYEKEPVRIYASEVDYNGDPCLFTGICVVTECQGLQANGLGETVLREMILSESYRQSFFATDIRIREITQGNQILDAVDRSLYYDALYLQHNVPRFNNPTGTFDNDQYLLQVFALAGTSLLTPGIPNGSLNTQITNLNNWLTSWLEDCGTTCNNEDITSLTECTPLVPIGPSLLL
jgi:hypothetical protein